MSIFSQILGSRPKRNKFDLSHERKLTCNMGTLIPMYEQEIIPGDRFQVNTEIMLRMSPMLAPIMHRVNVYTHFFFVPNRLVWNEWEDFITGGEDGLAAPIFPQMTMSSTSVSDFLKGSLADYFGLPITAAITGSSTTVSALPFRAYQMIYNEYYRDQNLESKIAFSTDSGVIADSAELSRLALIRNRAWEKDYFTSALPFAQRGPEVALAAEINYKNITEVVDTSGNPINTNNALRTDVSTAGDLHAATQDVSARIENLDDIGININDLRRATKLQEWLEKSARGGSRYIEQIYSHFGIKSSDARLQRPEYCGGGRSPVVISEVLSTVENTDTTIPQANMAGHGISVGANNGFKKRFEEHGRMIGIMSILPKTAYQDGLHRNWRKYDKFDYFWPEFANLGEQEIKDYEVYQDWAEGVAANRELTFGYQSRYAEYKYAHSSVHGDFRDDLDFWHMGRKFAAKQSLNESFVKSDPTQRIFAVTDPTEHKLYCQIYNRVNALRPMPYFGSPTL